jgi:hypothetical protein
MNGGERQGAASSPQAERVMREDGELDGDTNNQTPASIRLGLGTWVPLETVLRIPPEACCIPSLPPTSEQAILEPLTAESD